MKLMSYLWISTAAFLLTSAQVSAKTVEELRAEDSKIGIFFLIYFALFGIFALLDYFGKIPREICLEKGFDVRLVYMTYPPALLLAMLCWSVRA